MDEELGGRGRYDEYYCNAVMIDTSSSSNLNLFQSSAIDI